MLHARDRRGRRAAQADRPIDCGTLFRTPVASSPTAFSSLPDVSTHLAERARHDPRSQAALEPAGSAWPTTLSSDLDGEREPGMPRRGRRPRGAGVRRYGGPASRSTRGLPGSRLAEPHRADLGQVVHVVCDVFASF